MTKRELFLFWIPSTLILGFALGYVSQSKFCRVTINQRVDKEVSLKQQLRQEWAKDALFARQTLLTSTPSQNADHAIFSAQWLAHQKTLLSPLQSFVNQATRTQLRNEFTKQVTALISYAQNPQEAPDVSNNAQAIGTILARSNQAWAQDFKTIKNLLDHYYQLIIDQIQARKSQQWQKDAAFVGELFDTAMSIADELDRGIRQQFQQKL